MKELSIEEKAKAYDEALKYAMIYYKDGNEDMKMMMKTCFPVLVEESEDERIRKRIIHALHGDVLDMEETTKAIAWLEKQGEQKSVWSKEDMAMLDSAIAFVEYSAFTTIGKGKNNVIAWLKSIRDKAQPQPQPRQEWSEGDKRIIDNLISQLGNLYARKLIKEETKDKYVNWLKSLRPQSQWKPSKEQIEALDFAVDCIVWEEFCIKRKVLKGLLEQLRKL
jgi:hypothetical protein